MQLRWWQKLSWHLWEGLVYLDYTLNYTLGWMLGGGLQPWGMTVSDRLYLLKAIGSVVGKVGCAFLGKLDPKHCEKAIEEDKS